MGRIIIVVSVLIAVSVVLCSISLQFGRGSQTWLDKDDTRWLLSLQISLILLSSMITNSYIAFAIIWITLHPYIVHIMYSYGPYQFAPDRISVYQPLFPILWWTALYTTLTSYPVSWRVVAWTLVTWGIVNIVMTILQEGNYFDFSWILDDRTPKYPQSPGLVGGSFLLSFLTAMSSLSTAFIIYIDHYYYLLPLLAIFIFSSLRTGTISPMLSVAIPCLLFLTTIHIYYYLLIACVSGVALSIAFSSFHTNSIGSRLPAWKSALHMCRTTYFLGIGLGMWNALTNPIDQHEQEGLLWRNLHNDWLQSIVELSPVPAMCAICLLITSWRLIFQTTPPPAQLFGLLVTSSISIYAIVYFPMRDHMPSILLAVALSML